MFLSAVLHYLSQRFQQNMIHFTLTFSPLTRCVWGFFLMNYWFVRQLYYCRIKLVVMELACSVTVHILGWLFNFFFFTLLITKTHPLPSLAVKPCGCWVLFYIVGTARHTERTCVGDNYCLLLEGTPRFHTRIIFYFILMFNTGYISAGWGMRSVACGVEPLFIDNTV